MFIRRKKKDIFGWWSTRFDTIKKIGNISAKDVYNIVSRSISFRPYTKGSWTLIKLGILAYYLDIYTVIASKYLGKRICYIDTMAGPGIVYDKDTDLYVFGSPILALKVPRQGKEFNKLVFVDKKVDNIKILWEVISHIKKFIYDKNYEPNIRRLRRDMNKLNYAIITRDCDHSLFFIDPEGMEVEYETLKKISQTNSDIVLSFMISSIKRELAKAIKKPTAQDVEALDKFFGDHGWKDLDYRNDKEILEFYINKLRDLKGYHIPIRVPGPGSFYYYVIIMLKKETGFVRAIQDLKNRVEKMDYKTLLQILKGYTHKNTLDKWL